MTDLELHLLKIGFAEDTVVYKLMPKEVGRLKHATIDEVANYLLNNNIHTLVIDSAQPTITDALKQRRFLGKLLKTMRLPEPRKHIQGRRFL